MWTELPGAGLGARIFGAQPVPPPSIVLATAAIALLVVAPDRSWRLARNLITIAHEGGHAAVSVLTGRRLAAIRLHSDTSGLTVSRGRPDGLGMVFTLLAGYLTPSLLGLAGAVILTTGRIALMLWVGILLLLAMLVMVRNAYGIVAVLVTGAAVGLIAWSATSEVQAMFAYLGVWFLLLGGVRPVAELQGMRRRGRRPGRPPAETDADQLARVTPVGAFAWVVLFGLVNLLALTAGAVLLAGPALTALD